MFMVSYKIVARFTVIFTISLFLLRCSGHQSSAVNVVGSTSVQPFAELLAEDYIAADPSRNVEVQGGGSTAGLQAILNDLADIGMCSRALSSEESAQFNQIVIARDGLAIVVNPHNPVETLSSTQLRGLFSGAIKNWKEVGGADSTIHLITREEGSGTRESFVHLVMDKERISRRALTQESNGAVKELVRNDPAAIGYMSLGLVDSSLRSVRVDDVEATSEQVISGNYKLARPFLFITKGDIKPETQHYLDFVLSDTGQKILETEGLVRVK